MTRRFKRYCSGLLCALLLLSGVLPALAESGNTILFARDEAEANDTDPMYVSSIAVVGDMIYILGSGLFSYRIGDAEPVELLSNEQMWGYSGLSTETVIVDAEGSDEAEADQAAVTDQPEKTDDDSDKTQNETENQPDDDTQAAEGEQVEPTGYSLSALIGGDALYALDSEKGRLGEWDEASKSFAWDIQLNWEGMTREQDGWKETLDMRSLFMVGDTLYMLCAKEFDMWDEYVVRAFDITTGSASALPLKGRIDIVVAYRPGKLVALVTDADTYEPSIVLYDIASGKVEDTLSGDGLSGDIGGIAYDAATDTLYVAQNNVIQPLANKAFGEPAAYLGSQGYRSSSAITSTGHFVSMSYDGVYVRSLDAKYKPAGVLRIASGYMDNATSKFARANPEIGIEITENLSWSDQGFLSAITSKDTNVDVYSLTTSGEFANLYEKGYLADLSSSPALMAAVEAMYPAIRDAVLVDGKLYGYPANPNTSFWAADEAALQRVGFDGAPKTFDELLDMIEQWENEDMAEDNPGWRLLDGWFNKQQLLGLIIQSYVARYESADQPLKFDTPVLRRLLERLEQLPEFGIDYNDEAQVADYSYNSAIMLNSSASPFSSMYSDQPDYAPLLVNPPVFEEGEEPQTIGMLTVYAVNPESKNIDLAIKFFEYLAENDEPYNRYQLRTDLSEPVAEPYAVRNKKQTEEMIAEAEERVAKADASDQQSIQDEIDMYKSWMADYERYYWQLSAEQIANYREIAPTIVINTHSIMLNYSSVSFAEFWKELQQYSEGQMKLDELLRSLDKKAQMVFYEGQ